jgi:ubiquitin C-terminal hydrolase
MEFPESLDMSPFVNTSYPSEGHVDLLTEDTPLEGPHDGQEKQPLYYDLKAIVIHIGSADFGHYITFARPDVAGQPSQWLMLDDDRVTEVSREDVMITAFGGKSLRLSSTNAYILFYEKRPNLS